MKAAIGATYFAFSVMVLLLSWDNYKFAIGQTQQQFQNYQNPTLGISIQYPSDWELQEESNDKLRFVKQEGFVTADLNVENLDESGTTVSEYANTRVNELQAQRPEFQLISNDPITISNKPAQKVVYTFEREEDGKTNKVMRIWSTEEDKLYTLAYVAELGQYDRYLPSFQRMVDSFRIGDSGSGSSATQVQSSDSGGEDSNGNGNCDPSYPDVCIKSPPPNLNCPDVPYKDFKVIGNDPHGFDGDNDGIGCESTNGGGAPPPGKCDRVSYPDSDICIPPYPPDLNCPDITYTNFRVTGADPHGFDRDNDGIGCESGNGGGDTPPSVEGNCDPSYPTVCIKSPPPNLNCGDISDKNFQVIGSDPHGFDRDNDGIGCDTTIEDTPMSTPLTPTITPPVTPLVCDEGDILYEGQCLVDDYDCEDTSDFEDPRCAGREPPSPTPAPQVTTTPEPTPTMPTPPVDLSPLAQSQPQCEFGISPETGTCNTEDIFSEPSPPTPEPTPTPDEPDQGDQGDQEDDTDTDSGNIGDGDNDNGTGGDNNGNGGSGSGEIFE